MIQILKNPDALVYWLCLISTPFLIFTGVKIAVLMYSVLLPLWAERDSEADYSYADYGRFAKICCCMVLCMFPWICGFLKLVFGAFGKLEFSIVGFVKLLKLAGSLLGCVVFLSVGAWYLIFEIKRYRKIRNGQLAS